MFLNFDIKKINNWKLTQSKNKIENLDIRKLPKKTKKR